MPGKGLRLNPAWHASLPPLPAHLMAAPDAPLPDYVDLRGWVYPGPDGQPQPAHPLGPVDDQGPQGSCTGHAARKLLEALHVIAGGPFVRLSAAMAYAGGRELEGTIATDAGADPQDVLKYCQRYGLAPERDWPYNPAVWNVAPTNDMDALGWPYRLGSLHAVPDWQTAKRILAGDPARGILGRPITACIGAYPGGYDATGPDGQLPVQARSDTQQRGVNHNVTMMGYWNGECGTEGSWGSGFGWQGTVWCPEEWVDAVYVYLWTATYPGEAELQ